MSDADLSASRLRMTGWEAPRRCIHSVFIPANAWREKLNPCCTICCSMAGTVPTGAGSSKKKSIQHKNKQEKSCGHKPKFEEKEESNGDEAVSKSAGRAGLSFEQEAGVLEEAAGEAEGDEAEGNGVEAECGEEPPA
jgi:hypothetical protein